MADKNLEAHVKKFKAINDFDKACAEVKGEREGKCRERERERERRGRREESRK